MGDITRGETFADGETVNAERLHKLVDGATLNPGSVGTPELADGAVTTEKLAASAVLPGGKVQLAKDKILVGDELGFASERGLSGEFVIDGNTVSIKDASITTAKLADGAVTPGKLADVTPAVTAGEYGSATKVPKIKIDVKGRVIEASEVAIAVGAVLTKYVSSPDANVPLRGAFVPFTITPAPTGTLIALHGFLVAKGATPELGRIAGDLVPMVDLFSSSGGNEYPSFTLTYTPATNVITVTRLSGFNLTLLHKTTGSGDFLSESGSNLNTNWAMRVVALFA